MTQVRAGVRKFTVGFSPWIAPYAAFPDGIAARAGVSTGLLPDEESMVTMSAGPKAFTARARIDGRACRATKAGVTLSSRGLPPPPVRFIHRTDCAFAGRVLIRARVVSDGSRVTRAELAVRMEKSGAPIAYVRIDRDGSGASYAPPRCD